MKIVPQQMLVFAGSAVVAIVIIAAFLIFAAPHDKSYQREKILASTLLVPDDRHKVGYIKISETKPNTAYYFTYPSSYELGKNENAYQTFILIRLPEELGGNKNDSTAFRAYSALSINSHCLMKYWSQEGRKRIEDPCHGDMIRPQDGLFLVNSNPVKSGIFVAQPYLGLSADPEGYLYVEPPIWEMNKNGVVGIGRSVTQDDLTNAAMSDFENYVKYVRKELKIPDVLSDDTIITPGTFFGQFIYVHPQDARITHSLDISFCNCTNRDPFKVHGSHHFQVWGLRQERIYTDQWLIGPSAYPFSKVTFYRNGYELVFSGPSLDKTLDLVFDNFYQGKNRSMLEWVSEIKRG